MGDEIYESLMDISETLQTLREQIESLSYLLIPEDEDMDASEYEDLCVYELTTEEEE